MDETIFFQKLGQGLVSGDVVPAHGHFSRNGLFQLHLEPGQFSERAEDVAQVSVLEVDRDRVPVYFAAAPVVALSVAVTRTMLL
jgi:hypothetical protein